jgi:hypothetical protein
MVIAAEVGQAGAWGTIVVLLLIIACVFLFRSMTKQLRKVPKSFDPPPGEPERDRKLPD